MLIPEERSKARRKRALELVALVLAICSALPLCILWFHMSGKYPYGDPSFYLALSKFMYGKFHTEGMISGVEGLYSVRNSKALFHPVLAVPAFFFSKGNALLAQAIACSYIYALLAGVSYLFARLYLDPVDAVLAVAILTNTQWVFHNVRDLNTELPCTVAYIAVCLAVVLSDRLTRKKASWAAALLFGICFCIRPVETLILSAVPLAAFAYSARSSGTPPRSDFIRAAILVFIASLGAFCAIPVEKTPSLVWLFALGPVLAAFVYKKYNQSKVSSYFPVFALVVAAIGIVWFGPFVSPMISWIRTGSIDVTGQPRHIGFATIFGKFYGAILGPGTIALIALASVIFFFRRKSLKRLGIVAALVGLSTLLHLSLGAYGENPTVRYYFPENILLYLIVLITLLKTSRWIWLQRSLAVVVLGIVIVGQLSVFDILKGPGPANFRRTFGLFEPEAPRKTDIFVEVMKQLPPEAKAAGVIVYPHVPGFQDIHLIDFSDCLGTDLYSVWMITSDTGIKVDCKSIYEVKGRNLLSWDTFVRFYRDHYGYFLAGPLDNDGHLQSQIQASKHQTIQEIHASKGLYYLVKTDR